MVFHLRLYKSPVARIVYVSCNTPSDLSVKLFFSLNSKNIHQKEKQRAIAI